MFSEGIPDHEKIRLELEQHIETAKSLINRVPAQGDAPADPGGAIAAMASSVLTIASAVQEAIAVTEFATLKGEATPLLPEFDDLIERLREIEGALRIVGATISASEFTGSPRREPRRDARRMNISTPAASMDRHPAGGSATTPSAAFADILTAIVAWWRCVQSKALKTAGGWYRKGRRSPSRKTRATISPRRMPPGRRRQGSGRGEVQDRSDFRH